MTVLTSMRLLILLPHAVFADEAAVARIVAETADGAFGLLPNRLDCAAALVPGILIYATPAHEDHFVALDQGLLVKAGAQVRVSVRHALAGDDLGRLRSLVEEQFLVLGAQERSAREVVAKVEAGLLRRMARLRHD